MTMPEATPTPPPTPSPGAATGMGDTDDHIVERRSLRDYYIILRERLWIALPLALLVSVSIGYYQSKEVPMYRTSATMQFVTKKSTVVNTSAILRADWSLPRMTRMSSAPRSPNAV